MWYLHKLNARNLPEKALAISPSVCWGLCWSQRAHRKECIHRKRKKASFLVFPRLSLSLSISFTFYFFSSYYPYPPHAGLQKEPLFPFSPTHFCRCFPFLSIHQVRCCCSVMDTDGSTLSLTPIQAGRVEHAVRGAGWAAG